MFSSQKPLKFNSNTQNLTILIICMVFKKQLYGFQTFKFYFDG